MKEHKFDKGDRAMLDSELELITDENQWPKPFDIHNPPSLVDEIELEAKADCGEWIKSISEWPEDYESILVGIENGLRYRYTHVKKARTLGDVGV